MVCADWPTCILCAKDTQISFSSYNNWQYVTHDPESYCSRRLYINELIPFAQLNYIFGFVPIADSRFKNIDYNIIM